jgi:UDP-N-acetylmuramoyl-L-alanyl-D-glutamate--2,6-diaminopimelate ligase
VALAEGRADRRLPDGSVAWATVPDFQHSRTGLRPRHVQARELAELAEFAKLSRPTESPTLLGAGVAGAQTLITGITADSSDVASGDLFAALPGTNSHGIDYADQAAAAGAAAVLTDPTGAARWQGALPVLVVADPRAVLGAVSAMVYGNPSRALPVLGVTGTSGKTTTSFLVRAGLEAAGLATGVIGTVGVFLGDRTLKLPFTTPEAPQLQALLAVMLERGIQAVAMEVSSHALRLGRVDGTSFAVGAFTNLSQDHLDFHSDMADYFQAKALLFDGRSRSEVVVIDDEWGRQLLTPDTVTVSAAGSDALWRAEQISTGKDGSTTFTVRSPQGSFEAGCRIPGSYNVANTVLAFAMLSQLGIDVAAVAPALASAQVRGRMERVDGNQPFMAVVDYSHKPAGVAGALQALRPLTPGKLIIVLGCGGDRDRGKRPVMGEVAAREADVLIVTDDNPRSEDPAAIRAAMLAGASGVPAGLRAQVLEEGDRRRAIETAIALAGPGDTVLVAGKGHETGQQVAGTMLAFDDVSVLRTALFTNGFLPVGGSPEPDVSSS